MAGSPGKEIDKARRVVNNERDDAEPMHLQNQISDAKGLLTVMNITYCKCKAAPLGRDGMESIGPPRFACSLTSETGK